MDPAKPISADSVPKMNPAPGGLFLSKPTPPLSVDEAALAALTSKLLENREALLQSLVPTPDGKQRGGATDEVVQALNKTIGHRSIFEISEYLLANKVVETGTDPEWYILGMPPDMMKTPDYTPAATRAAIIAGQLAYKIKEPQ